MLKITIIKHNLHEITITLSEELKTSLWKQLKLKI
jgi:hypothetical protein